ncbi:MAG: GspE/PulE family protein [Pseudomonadota bacterium]
MTTRLEILERLHAAGFIGPAEQSRLLRAIEQSHEPIDVLSQRLGVLSEADIANAYAQLSSRPLETNPSSSDGETPISTMNNAFLKRRRIAPIVTSAESLKLYMADPFDNEAVDGVRFAVGDEVDIDIHVTTPSAVERMLDALEEQNGAAESDASLDNMAIDGLDADLLRDLASAEPSIRTVQSLIANAGIARASDIHIETAQIGYRLRHRIDGALKDAGTLSKTAGLRAISRLKILSNLDIAEQRRPQDGRTSFALDGRMIDLRLATTPTTDGENLVVRLLDQDAHALDLKSLGFSADDASLLGRLIKRPNGMIILTGPTGSGKTTTLYALLSMLADGERKILTIEDPVEYKLDGVNQTQVNSAINLTFANGLRAFLRQDPDVVMVGEIRDLETAEIAMRAALTGHLVFSTLHTNTAAAAVTRLKDIGVAPYLIASTLAGVVGQRLVRRFCDACGGGGDREDGAPCPECGGTGYRGRLVIAECMEIDDDLRDRIKSGDSDAAIAAASGRPSIYEDGMKKAEAGLTGRDEVTRACGS